MGDGLTTNTMIDDQYNPSPLGPTPSAPPMVVGDTQYRGASGGIGSLTGENLVGAGATGATGSTGATTTGGIGSLDPSQSTLSPNFAPYIYDMLSRGQGLMGQQFQPFTGQRFAGPSALQQQAFTGASQLGGTFDPAAAQRLMNPYLEQALNPQLDLLRRQADISLQGDLSKYTQAGAFGGSRGAIAQALNRENLGQQMERVTGQGYKDAYDRAMQQYNTEQGQNLQNLNAQATLGATQQGFAQQPLDFGFQQWQQSLDFPYKNLSAASGLLEGLSPAIAARPYTDGASTLGSMMQGGIGGLALYNLLFGGS